MRMKSLPLGVPLLARSLHAIARSSMPSSWPPPSRPPAVCLAPFYQKRPCCILRLCMCISVCIFRPCAACTKPRSCPTQRKFAALVHALPSLLVLCMMLLQSHHAFPPACSLQIRAPSASTWSCCIMTCMALLSISLLSSPYQHTSSLFFGTCMPCCLSCLKARLSF